VTYANTAVRALLGYDPAEVVSTPFEDYVSAEDRERARELWQQVGAGRAVHGARLRVRGQSGRELHVACDAVPCLDAEGRFLGAHGVVRATPFPERLAGEPQSLLEQLGALRDLHPRSGVPGGLTEVLEAVVRYPARLGVDLCWIGLLDEGAKAVRPIVHHGANGCLLATVSAGDVGAPGPAARAIETRQAVVVDLAEALSAPGPLVEAARAHGYHALAVVPMAYGERVLGAIFAYSRQPGFFDGWRVFLLELFALTAAASAASAQAFERARRSEEGFQQLTEGLPCVAYVVRPTMPPTFLFITSNVERLLGYTPDEFYADGSLAFRAAHPEDREYLMERVRQATGRPEPYTVRYRAIHRNGKDISYVAHRSMPLVDSSGRVALRQGVIVDITEQRRLEHELLQSQRLAAIGEMAAMIAHEVRNPLAGMSLALRMLRSVPADSPLARECLDDLETGLQRVNATISRVLDFSKALPMQFRRCSLADIVGAAQRLTATYIRKNKIELRIELPPGLPEPVADAAQLEQIFVSLILNACKAMPDGGCLTVRARPDAGRLAIEVADTGIGIEREHLADIFNPFYSGIRDGVGLGLPLCQRIVGAHGGMLRVESAPGQGTTFHIELPLEPPDAARPAR